MKKLFHHQTSVAAVSTMYQLSQNGDKQEKLFAELKKALSGKDSAITSATLDHLPYLKACIKETLRMFPVVLGNGRSLQSDAVISGYNVPKGVNIGEWILGSVHMLANKFSFRKWENFQIFFVR